MALYSSESITMTTVLLLALSPTLLLVQCAVIQVIPDPEVSLTCWSCPEHPDNEACNDWAPDVFCPLRKYFRIFIKITKTGCR